jgi:hypothetical protein
MVPPISQMVCCGPSISTRSARQVLQEDNEAETQIDENNQTKNESYLTSSHLTHRESVILCYSPMLTLSLHTLRH